MPEHFVILVHSDKGIDGLAVRAQGIHQSRLGIRGESRGVQGVDDWNVFGLFGTDENFRRILVAQIANLR
jgi:hypothetical protein